jgi:UDP-3-O-[3-hydroxymyristoyl] glucosamine N-acyltransferase
VLRYAMVCEEAVIGAGASVEAGSIVSYKAVIGPRATLPRYARISLCRQIAHEVGEGSLATCCCHLLWHLLYLIYNATHPS